MFGREFGESLVEGFLQKVEVADHREGWKESWWKVGEFAAEVGGKEK